MKKFRQALRNLLRLVQKFPVLSALLLITVTAYAFCLPEPLFRKPYSTVIESSSGELLSARIAADAQWRFPQTDSVPEKFSACLLAFEDAHFYHHPGFNPVAIAGAWLQNRRAGRIVRGGSTLTQQVIRLSRQEKRSYFEKAIEIILATRLELRYSKKEILALYAAHAPFGGNVVGLEMAAWRYFGVKPHQLSWAESATLAVLPNAPGLIFPGKNQQLLRQKRNALLKKLQRNGTISALTYSLAIREPLVGAPYPLPDFAPHLLQEIAKTRPGTRVRTTVNASLQERVNRIASTYYQQFRHNEVHNLAVLIVDVKTRNIAAYVGNAPTTAAHQKDVDIITAPRSTGSVLKPFLYASMLDSGELLPDMLIADVPTQIAGYAPQNFELTYDGAVPASQALSRSLNIPSVLMLRDYGVYRFYDRLQRLKQNRINRHPNHYGLSLILGGAESTLWDLCRAYSGLTGTLTYFTANNSRYRTNEFANLNWDTRKKTNFGKSVYDKPVLGAGAIWLTYKAMREIHRPQADEAWKFYESAPEIAWKTGTSFGNRDAWAVGSNSDYVVGVWVGNASGEGRPGLTGVDHAAPLLFDVFRLLPQKGWFPKPLDDLEQRSLCTVSGFIAGADCSAAEQDVPHGTVKTTPCPYHKRIFIDDQGRRVSSSCSEISSMTPRTWFVLPPVMEWYYRTRHIDYAPLPAWKPGCDPVEKTSMAFIYPKANARLYLTKDFSGKVQPVILKMAHSRSDATIFWYLDRKLVGQTTHFHELQLYADPGKYWLTAIDDRGAELVQRLEIAGKE